jgi:hypothetical protein
MTGQKGTRPWTSLQETGRQLLKIIFRKHFFYQNTHTMAMHVKFWHQHCNDLKKTSTLSGFEPVIFCSGGRRNDHCIGYTHRAETGLFETPLKVAYVSPGGMAPWMSHPPQEQKTRVRIPPGYKDIRKNTSVLLCMIYLICIACVLIWERNALATIVPILKYFFKVLYICSDSLNHWIVSRSHERDHKWNFLSSTVFWSFFKFILFLFCLNFFVQS